MRGRLLPALLLGLLLLCVLIATAPASLLALLLPREQVLLQGLSGTVWHGRASRAMIASNAGYVHLGRLEWQLKPLSLFLLSPAAQIDTDWGAQRLSAEVQRSAGGDIRLRDADAQVSAALLGNFLPVRLGGDFSLQAEELRLRDGLPQRISGRLVWQGAGWESPRGMRPLGTYAVDVSTPEDGKILGEVLTLSGEVSAEGEVRWEQGRYGVDILLRGAGLDDPQLRQALQLMAAPEGEGFRVRLDGTLPAAL